MWREVPYVGQEFKKLSAIPHFLWALGGDFQVYVYVHGLDVPIRLREESYENERWIPIDGFSTRLLPTDRYRFSSADGTVDRAISKIRLPSMAWQWEGDWTLELQLDGQPLDHDGWTYAVDFPAQYHAKKQWKSCVRRRLWVRNRKYVALNSWCAIAPLHKDATSEPFIDIAVGGQHISGAEPGVMVVWAVTSNNRVMLRNGVSTRLPEGSKWTLVSTPSGCEADQLAVGGSGNVWAALLDGRALVRVGVSRDCHMGTGWVEVRGPGEPNTQISPRICHLAVGSGSGGSMGAVGVWAITQDKKTWFRKGVQIDNMEDTRRQAEESVVGLQWVEMVGRMTMISVSASSNQVFAISADDRSVYYRVGITATDLTGKRWKQLRAPLQVSRASSTATLGSRNPSHHSSASIDRANSLTDTTTTSNLAGVVASAGAAVHLNNSWQEQSHSAPNAPTSLPAGDLSAHQYFEAPLKNPKAWSPVRSVGSVVGTEVHSNESIERIEREGEEGCIFAEDEEMGWAEYESRWWWVEVGACTIDPNHLPLWLSDVGTLKSELSTVSSGRQCIDAPWRQRILQDLRKRERVITSSRISDLDSSSTALNIKGIEYELAVEGGTWTHSGEARWAPGGGSDDCNGATQIFVDCILQLERQTGFGGTLTILADDGATSLHNFVMDEVTCIQCCSEPGNARLAVHTPQIEPAFIRLQFAAETILEEWLDQFKNACAEIHCYPENVNTRSLWATTSLGDIFVCDTLPVNGPNTLNDHEIDLLGFKTPFTIPLHLNCIPGTILTFSGNIPEGADRFSINLEARPTYRQRHKAHSELGNTVLHFNPRFRDRNIVRNTMMEGKWGAEEKGGTGDGGSDCPMEAGEVCAIKVLCRGEDFVIFVADREYCTFRYRTLPASAASIFSVCGVIEPFKLRIQTTETLLSPMSLHWRQVGGHLRRIETCELGVTWGVAYDHTAWVYTGAPLLQQNAMNDNQDYRIYENQRWNPISGYSSSGLPTDRYSWSDITGKQRRTKDHVKLLSRQWQWVSDWLVDFHVAGGVDRDGWQYAVDFPSTYHAQKHFTDYVRRRRWYRRCAISTSGPWIELGRTKLLDITLQPLNREVDENVFEPRTLSTCDSSDSGTDTITASTTDSSAYNGVPIIVWALATGGQVMFRDGVTTTNPTGTKWEHVPSDQPFCSVSSFYDKASYKLWAIGNNGCAYMRLGITANNQHGDKWRCIEPPNGSNIHLKQVSVGALGVWCLDISGRLYLRRDVTDAAPQGTCWQCVPPDPPSLPTGCTGFRQVALGVRSCAHAATTTAGTQQSGCEVWAVTNTGVMLRREGISEKWPAGTGWDRGIQGIWQHISIRAFN